MLSADKVIHVAKLLKEHYQSFYCFFKQRTWTACSCFFVRLQKLFFCIVQRFGFFEF